MGGSGWDSVMGPCVEPDIVESTRSVDGSFGSGRVAVYFSARTTLRNLCAAGSDPVQYHHSFVLAG